MEQAILLLKIFLRISLSLVLLFLIPGIISYTNINYLKISINDKVATSNLLLKFISKENASFKIAVHKDKENFFTYSSSLLEEVTNIDFNDLRTFIGIEIQGDEIERNYYVDTSYYSIESSPPHEELLLEREVAMKELAEINKE